MGSRFGLLLPALVAVAVLAWRAGVLALPRAAPAQRALFGGVAALALVTLGVRILGFLGLLGTGPLLALLAAVTVAAVLVDRRRRIGLAWRGAITAETAPVAVVALGAVAAACVAAWLLPVWQWDSLGYHLAYVDFALQAHGFGAMPASMPYVTDYPHVVENAYLAWRAMLPDDRLVDAAQLPFALLGSLAIAALARQEGARREHAVAAGLLWLTLPAVFLQLPTNYVDVGAAALLLAATVFVLAEPTAANVVAAGVALGLFLGSKPNAPVGTTLLFGVLAVRAFRAGRRAALGIAAGATLVLGAESYVRNAILYRNPTWPVRLTIGPIVFPGQQPMSALLEAGCAAPRLAGALPLRLLRSWTALDAPPVFDMRYGGLGLVFLVALPVAVVVAVRRRRLALAVVALAALASPDPVVPRYILAFPGLVFALAAAPFGALTPRLRRVALAVVAVAAAIGLGRVFPALAGDGPALGSYLAMDEDARLRAVGADGSPRRFYDALATLPPGSTTGFDGSLELPYLAWPIDLATKARRLPDAMTREEAERVLDDRSLSLLIIDDRSTLATAARERADLEEAFQCRTGPPPACMVAAAAGRPIPSCVVFRRK